MNSGIEFRERIKELPSDFYFDNKEHFFYACKGIIKGLNIINPNAVAPTLTNFCYILFEFTINNLEKITELKLKYPTEVYSRGLRFATNATELLDALKKIEVIMEDYKTILSMSFDAIEESEYKKYFEPKRFNRDYKAEKEREKKKKKLEMQIDTSFRWNGYHIDKDKLTNELCDLVDVSGIYRIYNNKKELIYIGKSYTLGTRIPSSLKERKGCMFDYCIIPNKADTDIYEIYYISTLQPICNNESNTGDTPTIKLPELKFVDIINVYTDNNDKVIIEKGRNNILASIAFRNDVELDYIIDELSESYDISHISEPKINEYDKFGTEFIVRINLKEKQPS